MAIDMNFSEEIELAVKSALAAGKAIINIYRNDFSVSYRDNEPVTEADAAANKAIDDILSGKYQILSEEGEQKMISDKKCWIVDPLDGTTDFVKRTGEFTVMIGLLENFRPIGGVVYAPDLDILYAAEKGRGAYLRANSDWKKIRVNDHADITKFNVLMSRNHISPQEQGIIKELKLGKVASLGSSLKTCKIAEGEAELYFTTTDKIKIWDICAANCVLAEAGGLMTDLDGNELDYSDSSFRHRKGIVVSNNKIHEQIISDIKEIISL